MGYGRTPQKETTDDQAASASATLLTASGILLTGIGALDALVKTQQAQQQEQSARAQPT
jgi:hypothetical protein